jgi:hypothetical protein
VIGKGNIEHRTGNVTLIHSKDLLSRSSKHVLLHMILKS